MKHVTVRELTFFSLSRNVAMILKRTYQCYDDCILVQHKELRLLLLKYSQQECIPVGCVPTMAVAIICWGWCLPRHTHSGRPPSRPPPPPTNRQTLLGRHTPYTTPLYTTRMTHTCGNITLPATLSVKTIISLLSTH